MWADYDEYPFYPDGRGGLQKADYLPRLFAAIAEIAQCALGHCEAAAAEKTAAELLAELQPYLVRIERCVKAIREAWQ